MAKSTIFFSKYTIYITIDYLLLIQNNKNLVSKIDKKAFIL